MGELHHDAEAALALEDLRDVPAFGGRLDRVLDVLDVDAVAGGGLAIDHDLELGLSDQVIVVEVGDASHIGQDVGDLAGLGLEHEDVGSIELDGQLALHAGQRLVDVVLDGLGEVGRDPFQIGERRGHRVDELPLVVEAPLTPRPQSDVELAGVGAIGIGAVIGRAELGDHHADLRKAREPLADAMDVGLGALERDADRKLHA